MDFGLSPKTKSIVGAIINIQQIFFLFTSDLTQQLKLWLMAISYSNVLNACLKSIHITMANSGIYLEFYLFQR